MLPPVVAPSVLEALSRPVVLADVRWYLDGRSGREAYDAGHPAGAVFVDLDRWLAAPPSPQAGRHPLPDPSVFAQGMASLGIGDADIVVAYDDAGGVVAARLVWLLRATGHAAALLDGGLAAGKGPLETATVPRVPATFTPRPWPAELLVGMDDLDPPDGPLIDARDGERFRGEHEPVDPRAGHVPGASSLPTRSHVGAGGRMLAPDELRRRFAAVGVGPDDRATAYCGSGITACHTLLALEVAGLPPGRLYPGSWSQWSHTDRPAATGIERGPLRLFEETAHQTAAAAVKETS